MQLSDSQVKQIMNATRRPKIFAIRGSAELIFGPEFKQSWFVTGYPRETVELLRESLGAGEGEAGTTTYATLPPIFYPNGDTGNLGATFTNPALVKVSRSF